MDLSTVDLAAIAGVVSGLGSLGIGAAVFWSNRGFSQRAQELSERTAAVEDQKFRLALLDRRSIVIDAIYEAAGIFTSNPSDAARTMIRAHDALRAAWLVYEPEARAQIRLLINKIAEWQRLDRRLGTALDEQRADLVEQLMSAEADLTSALVGLHDALVEISRVKEIGNRPA